jgi:hypothetical protein
MKLEQLMERRNQNQANMQQSINQQAQAQAQAQQAQAQQMMMNQNSMQGQVPRPTPQTAQQGFSHLQHQMQASPLPGQQPQQQAPMGIPHQGLPPNMTPNQQQQFQMSMQQSQQPQAQQNVPGRQPNGQQMSAQENALVADMTNRLMGQASEEEKNTLRTSLQTRMDPQQFQKYQAQGIDPLFLYYRNQAMHRLRQEKQNRLAQAQQLAQQTNIPGGAPMQQQRSMNPSPLNGQTQPATSMAGNPDFGSFMGNMENLAAQQQQQGVLAQEAGQMVVPASGAPRNGTPQPGVMPGQAMNMNNQRGVANPNPAVQQQQMLNAQQVQQRLQHVAQQQQQQQSQVQARLNAHAKAQQIALQGQPGGMGPGPMPPQQSPAMGTLNTPLRTPSQQMNHPEPPQANPNAQFGQPLDPRFMQGNQRAQGQANGFNAASVMFANVGPEAQQRLATLPPDKLNEVVTKWHEQRQMGGGNIQAGRPQMPMQANGQVRPGPQAPQPGQFNPQNAANQFMMGNPGQRTPQTMAAGMNPQQQLLLQQQMNALRPNQMQQRPMPPNMGTNEQRTVAQMDSFDIPPLFRNHATMPQGVPPDIKKWGQLKQWVAQNPNLGPDNLEAMKALQKAHYHQMVRSRSQAQSQPGAMQPGAPGGPVGMPTVPHAVTAPVAPMGQHPLQILSGMNVPTPGQIRQPTAQEIMNLRNHPSGKMAQATDDQIRAFYIRNLQNQMTTQLQQQQQQRTLMQMQMQRMGQQNGQQPHQSGQAQQNAAAMPTAQVLQAQMSQQKQPQPGPDSTNAAANAANASRAARPQPTGRNQAQTSSPAQPSKNLKRASSDDVVEVPNPNAQQSRPAPQQSQGSKQPNQQTRANLTREQVATVPENRKKFEPMIRAQANQASQAPQTANQANANRAPQMNPEQSAKLAAIVKEELERGKEPLPDIPMDSETKAATEELLKAIVGPLTNVAKVVSRWFLVTLDEGRTRAFYRAVS